MTENIEQTAIKPNNDKKTERLIFQTISNCLHPMAMLTYATLFLCFLTPLFILPIGIRMFIVLEVFFYTFVIPLLTIWLLYKLKLVKHWALRDRHDRNVPLLANLIAYCVCTFSVSRHGFIPSWGLCVFYGSIMVAFVSWVVSFWWKISGHALALSGLVTISWIYLFMFPGFVPLFLPFLFIILLGLLCSIRVYLGRHTLTQVYTGSVVGVILMWSAFAVML